MITAGLHHTACNGSETLLTSCVPDLKLDPFIVQHNLLDLEVNPGQDIKYSNGARSDYTQLHSRPGIYRNPRTSK